MAGKLGCAVKGKAGETRGLTGRSGQSGGSRVSQRRVCSDGALEKRVADAMNTRGVARAQTDAPARRDSWEQGVHPALIRELTAIWKQADSAYSFGGEWQRLLVLGEIADRLAVVISDAPALVAESAKVGAAERSAGELGGPESADGFAALRELLELQDLRDTINGRRASGDGELAMLETDYETRMSLALARARRVVAHGLASGQRLESPVGAAQ
ncbi:hypothetical protein LFL96_31675 [Paraburkholderia sp. D15]|uniref:hypothetical protein n=1 Tax=Paraburkholderia sp. D15 TaxID=2880218 RepID=UPI00247A45EE|nr:hypothetical protein [Paraburkholderia sp. D15]WGS52742.1 hypothetical protein LFL96_31675 [Paraburkholderia sp. D15]WKF61830.1 hypothetical protein HUO10_006362 [Paraburkholderia busanensis]